jgi:hypothetical protein
MNNKLIIIIVFFCSVLSTLWIQPTFSYFHSVITSATNSFTTTEWVPAHTSFVLQHDGLNFINQENVSSYIDVDGEHFQLNYDQNQPQFLSFLYKVDSLESAELFDTPSMIVYAGEQPIFQSISKIRNSDWQMAIIDLSQSNLKNGNYELYFKTQNTFDDLYLPEIQIKEVTTSKLFLNPSSKLRFYPSKTVASLNIQYKVWENNQEQLFSQILSEITQDNSTYFEFSLPENFYSNEFLFWSEDLYQNIEPAQNISIFYENNLGATSFQVDIFQESEGELNIQINYDNLSKVPKYYESQVYDHFESINLSEKTFHQYLLPKIPTLFTDSQVKTNHVFDISNQNNKYLTLKLCNTFSICETILENYYLE